MEDIRLAYAMNRAEELGRDVWEEFVVPLFFDQLEVRTQRKSLVVVGGRGCGKTTLLRYFSHNSQFSSKRHDIPASDLDYIGLYLRADTNFLSSLRGGGLTDETWHSAFRHSLACDLGIEVLDSLRSINCDESRVRRFGGLKELQFEALRNFDPKIGISYEAVRSYLVGSRDQLLTWINNLESGGLKPVFLPAEQFVKRLIQLVRDQLPYLRNSLFAVFIDEYENLHDYQQRMINGLIKHGEPPLVFNIAMKRHGMQVRGTLGNESIQAVSDYRQIDLEERWETNFSLFAAELLFFRLIEKQREVAAYVPIDPTVLRDISKVPDRRDNTGYQERVLGAARKLLPRLTEADLATTAFSNSRILERLHKNIQQGLNAWNSNIDPAKFIRREAPDASLVSGALLNRNRERPETILEELEKYILKESNRFDSSEWIKNNLVGVVLQLYATGQTPCPFFAGFENFVLMAHENIRQFLELVHQAFVRLPADIDVGTVLIHIEDQAEAVRTASSSFVREVRGCGTFANQLHGMVLTLGATLKVKHQQVSQSEPEITHFYIQRGDIDDDLDMYLRESVKWSVLFEEPETKKKSMGAKTFEYVLNPVFAGHFQISFRKKRSLPISANDLKIMFTGDVKSRDAVVKALIGEGRSASNLELDLSLGDD
ncbi:MAG: hypothetical protein AABM64_09355 [Pseudomonadota bacterium]